MRRGIEKLAACKTDIGLLFAISVFIIAVHFPILNYWFMLDQFSAISRALKFSFFQYVRDQFQNPGISFRIFHRVLYYWPTQYCVREARCYYLQTMVVMVISVTLVYLLSLRLRQRRVFSVITALLFGLSSFYSAESIGGAHEFSGLTGCVLGVGTILCLLHEQLAVALCLFVLSVLSYEPMVSLTPIILGVLVLKRRKLKKIIPFLLITLLYLPFRFSLQGQSSSDRVGVGLHVFKNYKEGIFHFFLPIAPLVNNPYGNFYVWLMQRLSYNYLIIYDAALFIVLLLLLLSGNSIIRFGVFWMVCALGSFVSQKGGLDVLWTYFPGIGFYYIVAELFVLLWDLSSNKLRDKSKNLFYIGRTCVLILLGTVVLYMSYGARMNISAIRYLAQRWQKEQLAALFTKWCPSENMRLYFYNCDSRIPEEFLKDIISASSCARLSQKVTCLSPAQELVMLDKGFWVEPSVGTFPAVYEVSKQLYKIDNNSPDVKPRLMEGVEFR